MKNTIKIAAVIFLIGFKVVIAGNLPQDERKSQIGIASYYSLRHDSRKTASGERFKSDNLTAAHKTLPFGTLLKVTNLANNKSVLVKINDRGPHVKGRIIDLSYVAAQEIGMVRSGMAKVKIEVIDIDIAEK